MNNIDKDIVSFYENQKLNDDFVNHLLKKRKVRKNHLLLKWYSAAALLVLLLLPAVFLINRHLLVKNAIFEIVKNHLKQEEIIYATSNYSILQENLSALDFNIMPANFPKNNEYQLLGGGYCSLQGIRAAQMKVRNIKTNTVHTLYAAPLNSTIKWLDKEKGKHKDIFVSLWSENSTLFGITEN